MNMKDALTHSPFFNVFFFLSIHSLISSYGASGRLYNNISAALPPVQISWTVSSRKAPLISGQGANVFEGRTASLCLCLCLSLQLQPQGQRDSDSEQEGQTSCKGGERPSYVTNSISNTLLSCRHDGNIKRPKKSCGPWLQRISRQKRPRAV